MAEFKIICEDPPIETIKKYKIDVKISELKDKLYMVVGIEAKNMVLTLEKEEEKGVSTPLDHDNKCLSEFKVVEGNCYVLRVKSNSEEDINKMRYIFNKNEEVKKYEISEQDYNKREDNFRKFKEKFIDKKNDEILIHTNEKGAKVGDRCQVLKTGTRGEVKFVGKTEFSEGLWVGVQLDEPVGKNDGSVNGKRYFNCPKSYGIFIQPDQIEIGDFPEEDIFSDDEEL
eukprot:TRINITY_DN4789_c0_g1_i1.p1 TRINITY_DN4789_c0_g1~~TRINITY_DN4789_c0_g1_i1.p1  ORF type:complete len:228 (-),score=84.48 TRINITY_DN4789_c0_g1_i1:55-738(-)